MTSLQNIIEHLELDLTDKQLHNGKKNENTNKYYWFRNQYYIVQSKDHHKWFIMSSNDISRELLRNHIWLILKGYIVAQSDINGVKTLISLHRMLIACENKMVDHCNRLRYDNRITNLRAVSSSENHRNITTRSDNKSGKNGVYRSKKRNTFQWKSEIIDDEGITHSKAFSVMKYGEEQAKQFAIAWRREKEVEYNYRGE